MKLEKFDLGKALNGAKVVTRDGREVTELTKFDIPGPYPVLGVVEGVISNWTIDGSFLPPFEENRDLFLAVEPQSIWVNVYKSNDGDLHLGISHNTKEEAIINHTAGYIKTIEITEEI